MKKNETKKAVIVNKKYIDNIVNELHKKGISYKIADVKEGGKSELGYLSKQILELTNKIKVSIKILKEMKIKNKQK